MRRRLAAAVLGALTALTTALAAPALAGTAAGPGDASNPDTVAASAGIHHVWLVVLENKGFQAAYVDNPNPYLAHTLPAQGQLLTGYHAIGHASLDNYLALLSGQAPNAVTQADCPDYVDLQPGLPGLGGQAVGLGCVYPSWVQTLPDQLSAAGVSWRGYLEDLGNDPTREPARCGAPGDPSGLGAPDRTQSATATDQYAARHNPFVYFHSLLDSGACAANVVPMSELRADLTSATTTPAFSFLTPNLCDDGHDSPCAGTDVDGSAAGGLTSIDHWLSTYVPLITSSPAFADGGLLVVTTDEADTSDTSSCCGEQPGPGSPLPGITGPGGGLVGAVVVGQCVPAGTTNPTPYDHYALLRSIEDMLGVTTGGADGHGHLGYAGATGLKPFGSDVFAGCAAPG